MTRLRPETIAAVRAEAERQLSPAEIQAYLATPMSDSERDELLAQIQWFRRRYPKGADRLAYVRRTYRRWTGAGDGG